MPVTFCSPHCHQNDSKSDQKQNQSISLLVTSQLPCAKNLTELRLKGSDIAGQFPEPDRMFRNLERLHVSMDSRVSVTRASLCELSKFTQISWLELEVRVNNCNRENRNGSTNTPLLDTETAHEFRRLKALKKLRLMCNLATQEQLDDSLEACCALMLALPDGIQSFSLYVSVRKDHKECLVSFIKVVEQAARSRFPSGHLCVQRWARAFSMFMSSVRDYRCLHRKCGKLQRSIPGPKTVI